MSYVSMVMFMSVIASVIAFITHYSIPPLISFVTTRGSYHVLNERIQFILCLHVESGACFPKNGLVL
ncbi:hypothetical protein EMIT079MI2_350040 [Bacillus sp. IT-79MI2]